MNITLISLKSPIGILRLGSPWQHLLRNISTIYDLEVPTPSGVRRPVYQGVDRRDLGFHGAVYGFHNSKTWIIIYLPPEPPPLSEL